MQPTLRSLLDVQQKCFHSFCPQTRSQLQNSAEVANKKPSVFCCPSETHFPDTRATSFETPQPAVPPDNNGSRTQNYVTYYNLIQLVLVLYDVPFLCRQLNGDVSLPGHFFSGDRNRDGPTAILQRPAAPKKPPKSHLIPTNW